MFSKAHANLSRVELFKATVNRFSELARQEGLSVLPYEGECPTRFASLSSEAQAATLSNFQRYVEVCDQAVSHRESLLYGKQFLWRMFQKLGLRPSATLLDNVEDQDIVEIYTDSYVQVFRSLSFFPICSYSLDDLLCRPFWELFHRDKALFSRMVAVTNAVVEGTITGDYRWQVEDHRVDEIDSPAMYTAEVRYKFLSPLHDEFGNVSAFINVFRVLSCTARRAHVRPGGLREEQGLDHP